MTYAIKWRSASDEHKYFTQTKGGAKTFYNLPEKLNGQKRIIIAEGEMDVLSLATAGIGFGEDEHKTRRLRRGDRGLLCGEPGRTERAHPDQAADRGDF